MSLALTAFGQLVVVAALHHECDLHVHGAALGRQEVDGLLGHVVELVDVYVELQVLVVLAADKSAWGIAFAFAFAFAFGEGSGVSCDGAWSCKACGVVCVE